MKKILVIGDACKDVYTFTNIQSFAPDKPVPVLTPINVVESPGMAGNVYENLKVLRENVHLICNSNWRENIKNRIVDYATNHMFLRIDSVSNDKRIDLSTLDYSADCIVLADYDKGFLTEDDIHEISSKHSLTFLDSKKILGSWAESCTFIKINEYEYLRSKSVIETKLSEKTIQTRSSKGTLFQGKVFNVEKQDVIDVSGAGDAFMAALVHHFIENKSIYDAINFANLKASQVVKRRGMTKLEL